MSASVLYVYAIGAGDLSAPAEGIDAIDGTRNFSTSVSGDLAALSSPVAADEFSQEAIDRHARDVDWLGAIAYRHQHIVEALASERSIIPLRAFTLFSNDAALVAYLEKHEIPLRSTLDRLKGKEEWTLKIGFDPERWEKSVIRRSGTLGSLVAELESTSPGKAFLLKKKIEEEKKKAARESEESLLAELAASVQSELGVMTLLEPGKKREGSTPQITLLIEQNRQAALERVGAGLSSRYAPEGVTLTLTGPWPPYSFAGDPQHG